MHPQKIVDDFKNNGASFVLENGELFLENQKNAIPETIEFAKHYKTKNVLSRILKVIIQKKFIQLKVPLIKL